MTNPVKEYAAFGYIQSPYSYPQYYAYQQWIEYQKSLKFADKLWPYRMAFFIQMITQCIMIWEIAVLVMPLDALRLQLYYLGIMGGVQWLLLVELIFILYTFIRSLEYRSYYKDNKYLISTISVVIAFVAGAYAAMFLVVS